MTWTEIDSNTTAASGSAHRYTQGAVLTPSGNSITPTDPLHHVAAGTISTIATTNMDAALVNELVLVANGAIIFASGGNISVKTGHLATNDSIRFVLDGATWREDGFVSGSLPFINVTDYPYNAVADGVTDNLAAFRAAIVALGSTSTSAGGRILVPAGDYYFSDTLHINRQIVLEGVSNAGFYGSGSRLLFAAGKTGIIIDRTGSTGNPEGAGYGDRTVLRYLAIVAQGKTAAAAHGVWMKGRARIEHCYIASFSANGIHIVANAGESPADNANGWGLYFVRSEGHGSAAGPANTGNGLFLDGADCNAGLAIAGDFAGNYLWGVWDSSFLGNTYDGCRAATNGDHASLRGGSFKTDGANAQNFFSGCYCEPDQMAADLVYPTSVVGGTWTGWRDAGASLYNFTAATTAQTHVPNGTTNIAVGDLGLRQSYIQGFTFAVANTAAAIKHKIVRDSLASNGLGDFANKITGASATYTASPLLDGSTAFATGAGILGATKSIVLFNSPLAQGIADNLGVAVVTYNNTTVAATVEVTSKSVNVNGTTQAWPALVLRNATSGAGINWDSLTPGQEIDVQLMMWIK